MGKIFVVIEVPEEKKVTIGTFYFLLEKQIFGGTL